MEGSRLKAKGSRLEFKEEEWNDGRMEYWNKQRTED